MNIADVLHGDLLPPFRMRVKTAWERYRFLSFWEKEPETIAWIRSFEDGGCFYDIGANIGMYSLYACHLHPRMTVWAFEPQWTNYLSLVHNAAMNRFDNLWPLLAGVSDRTGVARFKYRTPEAGASGGQIGDAGDYPVHIHALDDFSRLFGSPDYVKIDIDGQESKVIDGMCSLIADRAFKSCLVEMGKSGNDAQRIKQIFFANGYTVDNEFNSMESHSRNMPWRKSEEANIENVVFSRLP